MILGYIHLSHVCTFLQDLDAPDFENIFKLLIYGGFHKWWIPKTGWFIMHNSIKMDDLGVPLFQETSM